MGVDGNKPGALETFSLGSKKELMPQEEVDGFGEARSFHMGYCYFQRQGQLNCLICAHHSSGPQTPNPKVTGTNGKTFNLEVY